MSNWPGNLIRKTPVTPAGPLQNGAAPGIWSLAEASYWTKQGLWPTAGNFLAVEDVFSTWLYTGNGSTQTITNNLNISGQGGMVWIKGRSGATDHALYDTARGATFDLASNTTAAQTTQSTGLTSFSTTGFSISSLAKLNTNNATYASWTFRKAPKFFDVVTYTGNGTNRTIAHNLGVVPGMILVKRTDVAADWQVYHRSNANTQYMVLNTTAAVATGTTRWNSTTPTATEFTVGTDTTVNANGGTYVAYLFAHDTTSDGIIQCGSVTADGSGNATASLGWEPQWLIYKYSDTTGNWRILDNMRGWVDGSNDALLSANTSDAESSAAQGNPTATGFSLSGLAANKTFIYIAIRRGPMRTPTSGTSVFSPVAWTGTGATASISAGFPVDLILSKIRNFSGDPVWFDRLRGANSGIRSSNTNAEASYTDLVTSFASNTSVTVGADVTYGWVNSSGGTFADWMFRRAPSFFDEVCYTGTSVAGRTVSHNLGVAPELMIVKIRSTTGNWPVYSASLGNTKYLYLNSSGTGGTFSTWNNTSPTASVFSLGSDVEVNNSGATYVAYLFASCPGVSKVGSYTGTGTTQTINCGFTTGARFVLIKRTDSTGDWYVWDSARGIVAGNDPYLLLNSTAAEVTNTDYIDTDNSGFQISSTAPAAINANGGSFIYLAIS